MEQIVQLGGPVQKGEMVYKKRVRWHAAGWSHKSLWYATASGSVGQIITIATYKIVRESILPLPSYNA